MKISIKSLRQMIRGELAEARALVTLSLKDLSDPEKEAIRAAFQSCIQRLVGSGKIRSSADLASAVASLGELAAAAGDLAGAALRSIPLDVYKRLAAADAKPEGYGIKSRL
jgi:hypothetical protein